MAFLASVGSQPVITGIGVVAPNGIGVTDFWKSLLDAQSALTWLPLTESPNTLKGIGARVKDTCIETLDDELSGHLKRSNRMGLVAAKLALQDAEISAGFIEQLGTVPVFTSGMATNSSRPNTSRETNGSDTTGQTSGYAMHDVLNKFLHAHTVPVHVFGSNASGLEAAAVATRTVRDGFAPFALVIAVHTCLLEDWHQAAIQYHDVVSKFGNPSRASRPFDRDRFGRLPAEAAAAIIVEDARHARARGIQGYVEIAGFASVADQSSHDPMSGLGPAITMALANACEMPHSIGYISAYAPSDPVMDRVETQSIKAALGASAYRTPVSSIKGVTGDPKAAGGLLQLIATALAARKGFLPPTANYENADPFCDLDYVPLPRRAEFRTALIHAHTTSGQNQAMVVRNVI